MPLPTTTRAWPVSLSDAGVVAVAIAVGLACATGCSHRSSADDYQMNDTRVDMPAPAAGDEYVHIEPGTSLADQMERRYVLGPATAAKLGYRVDWQQPSSGASVRLVEIADDSVFVLDADNVLTRLSRESGDRIWRLPVADELEDILGITFIPEMERVYLMTGGAILELDSASGSQIGKQSLERIASTGPVVVGPYLVYGTRNGQLAWHAYRMRTGWRAYQIAHSIEVPPIYSDGHLVAVGADGRVMSLIASEASQVWNMKALAPIKARPTAGDGVVYVASLDQHLRAHLLGAARPPLWSYLTESPLSESPVLIGDTVYQHVPSEGLVALEAVPMDRPGGKVRWRAKSVGGNAVVRTRAGLVTWDARRHKLAVVETRRGGVVTTVDLPDVADIMATDVDEGEIYATGTNGRLVRLKPRS